MLVHAAFSSRVRIHCMLYAVGTMPQAAGVAYGREGNVSCSHNSGLWSGLSKMPHPEWFRGQPACPTLLAKECKVLCRHLNNYTTSLLVVTAHEQQKYKAVWDGLFIC